MPQKYELPRFDKFPDNVVRPGSRGRQPEELAGVSRQNCQIERPIGLGGRSGDQGPIDRRRQIGGRI